MGCIKRSMDRHDGCSEAKSTLSAYFAEILSERYGVPDRRGDEAIAADWAGKCEAYYELLAAQKAELSEYGYLKSWTLGDEQ